MSKSSFIILKQCVNCSNMFEAHKRTTKYCSHKCNSQHYKLKKRLELKKGVEIETFNQQIIRPKVCFFDLEKIKEKEFLTVNDVAVLLNCNKSTVYRMIKDKTIQAKNLNKKLTRIRRIDIELLFEE